MLRLPKREKVFVPQCCLANRENAFAVAVEVRRDGGEIWGEKWRARVVDADGLIHDLDTECCPACGAHLQGLELKKLERKRGRKS